MSRYGEGAWARGEILALGALAFLLVTTALWWATALWPVGGASPEWLLAARAVCFGVAHDGGLPSAGGWILLVGEPLGMIAALNVVWRDSLGSALRRLAGRGWGRAALAATSGALALGLAAVGWRVGAPTLAAAPAPAATRAERRLDAPAPPLRLLDQRGDTITLDRFAGRPVLVTFAFAQCETVCPLLVHDALEARRRLAAAAPALVVVTLDPWRDLPTRLPHIARRWGMEGDAFVAGGEIAAVEEVLREWGIARSRDPDTGEVAHQPVTFIVDPAGRLAYSTDGRLETLMRLIPRVAARTRPPGAAS